MEFHTHILFTNIRSFKNNHTFSFNYFKNLNISYVCPLLGPLNFVKYDKCYFIQFGVGFDSLPKGVPEKVCF